MNPAVLILLLLSTFLHAFFLTLAASLFLGMITVLLSLEE